MKQRLAMAVLVAILMLAAGCGGNAGFGEEDLALFIGGEEYRCGMDIREVVAVLGTEYDYAEGQSCDYDGLDKSYLYGVAEFYTNPLAEGDMVNEIYTRDTGTATSKGIEVGDTRRKVLDAYGEPEEDLGDLLIYRSPGSRASLCFELEEGRIWAIYLTTQPV